ncbi:amino acid permease [Mycolicibacterium confluentis]|uniref:Amino acid ABC transporter permease n=1 Tax=Mycolicibacterium confluentis TaxID=28047 RepID=A0A7I7XY35_9MYCO|nr:amino acid permease [Mycolicibacterium confluentis]MCV7317666.1 amino acid permease [Mycolicibacterium confluentis]ORV28260.1 amino acid ABC transporter permease [Mycolicibacterium confluentis]BBZ34285.1 amino acid ABC transporter permease [Mycolicibacterium confluentis]
MPEDKLTRSGVTYRQAGEGYFEKRQLKRTAGFWGLWGIGIAAVISGDFSGWNFGIGAAGWGGLGIASILIVIMYFGMLFSIGEMSAAMPHTGGAYSFARAAMGPWGGFVTGFAETIEYVFTTAVVVFFSASYANAVTTDLFELSLPMWLWWIILYALFVGLNSWGAAISFKFALVVAIISIGILVLFGVLALVNGAVDFSKLLDIAPDPDAAGSSTFLPFGWLAVLYALPFAMWFFLGIEELPLAAEEAHDPARDIPRAGLWGLVSLVGCGAIVFFLNPAVTGSEALGSSDEPLLDGFRAFLPTGWAAVLSAFALIGLLASLQGIMYAYGRNLYSLSRAGYYPKSLSLTGSRQTPYVALIVGAVIGFVALLIVNASEGAGAVVLNIAVWGAVLAYMLQMVSFVLLRRRFPNARRPWVSPTGNAGAWVAFVIAAVTFVGVLINPDYRPAVIAIVIFYVVGLLVFGLYGRHRLVLSPEEEYAVTGGLHGYDPEKEGLGGTIEDEILKGHTD